MIILSSWLHSRKEATEREDCCVVEMDSVSSRDTCRPGHVTIQIGLTNAPQVSTSTDSRT